MKRETFLPFEDALAVVHSFNLKNHEDWRAWARPSNVPSQPEAVYRDRGWKNWGHWWGNKSYVSMKDKVYLPFDKALAFARSLNMRTQKDWHPWSSSGARPANMPAGPHNFYKHKGFQSWGHWLGTGAVAGHYKKRLPFAKAVVFARSLQLRTHAEWGTWCKSGARPDNIPPQPGSYYEHNGWQGYRHWLGTDIISPKHKQFLSFPKALLRTLPQVGEWAGVEGVVQEWCTAGQYFLPPRNNLHARRVARVRALAWHRHSVN